MTNPTSPLSRSKKRLAVPLWLERFMAILILINYLLVIFDLSYIPLRDFWLQGRVQLSVKIGPFEKKIPRQPLTVLPISIAPWYDWVKGIEPYRSTEQYLERVDQLIQKVALNPESIEGTQTVPKNKPTLKPSEKSDTVEEILADLRERSADMIQTNPFQLANKTGALETIKNKMRSRVFGTTNASATQAFNKFWTKEYLLQNGFSNELMFFYQNIRPLIQTNYFRAWGENGQPINNFPLIDFPFFIIFLSDFLIRTRLISFRYPEVSWFDAMLWRWYDAFLLSPVFRWLRIIPLMIHLDQAELINLKKIRGQAVQGFVAIIAQEMTEVLVIRIIDQIQDLIRQGKLSEILSKQGQKTYLDINEKNEIVEITRIVSQVMLEKVLPQIQPDVEKFLIYNIEQILSQSTPYQQLQVLPGVRSLQTQMMNQIIGQLYERILEALQSLLKQDPVFDELLENLVENLRQTTHREMTAKQSFSTIETLLTELMEEVKINYVKELSQTDIDRIVEESRALRQLNRLDKK